MLRLASSPSHAKKRVVSFKENFDGAVHDQKCSKAGSFILNKHTKRAKKKHNAANLPFCDFPDFFLFVLRISEVAANLFLLSSATFVHIF